MAALMGEAIHRPIEALAVNFEEWAAQANIPEGHARLALRAMYEWYDGHGLPGNSLTLRTILSREPRTLRAYFGELAGDSQSSFAHAV